MPFPAEEHRYTWTCNICESSKTITFSEPSNKAYPAGWRVIEITVEVMDNPDHFDESEIVLCDRCQPSSDTKQLAQMVEDTLTHVMRRRIVTKENMRRKAVDQVPGPHWQETERKIIAELHAGDDV